MQDTLVVVCETKGEKGPQCEAILSGCAFSLNCKEALA